MKLVAEYGISRTPLREALKVLAAEGLVTMKVRRGAFVTEVSRDDLAEVYHLLGLLESDAAAVAAGASETPAAPSCRRCTTELEAPPGCASAIAFFAINERFHMRCSRSPTTAGRRQIVADLRKVMKLNRHHSLFKQGRLEESLAEHRALMQAIEGRDAPGASALMRTHFLQGLAAAA
jgi:DNA-binding GntR family transcriptional regulator